jgi:hypothetical protein
VRTELAQLVEDSRRAVEAIRKAGAEDMRHMVGIAQKRKADAEAAIRVAKEAAERREVAEERAAWEVAAWRKVLAERMKHAAVREDTARRNADND